MLFFFGHAPIRPDVPSKSVQEDIDVFLEKSRLDVSTKTLEFLGFACFFLDKILFFRVFHVVFVFFLDTGFWRIPSWSCYETYFECAITKPKTYRISIRGWKKFNFESVTTKFSRQVHLRFKLGLKPLTRKCVNNTDFTGLAGWLVGLFWLVWTGWLACLVWIGWLVCLNRLTGFIGLYGAALVWYNTGLTCLAFLNDFTGFTGFAVFSGFAFFSGFTVFVLILWPS